jgi:hypothetical protein
MKRCLVLGAAGLLFFCCCRQMKKLRLADWRTRTDAFVPFTAVGPEFAASSPALLRLKTGELALAFRGSGKTRGGPDHGVFLSRSGDEGLTWTKPRPVLTGLRNFKSPALSQLPEGQVVLTYCTGPGSAPQSG